MIVQREEPDVSAQKIKELKIKEMEHRAERLKENITRGEMEGWAGMVFERADAAYKAVRVILRTLVRLALIKEQDLVDEEKLIVEEMKALEEKKKLCPNDFYFKTNTNVCKLCRVRCPYAEEDRQEKAEILKPEIV